MFRKVALLPSSGKECT